MQTNGLHREVNMAVFQAKRRLVQPESLLPYSGKHIIWNEDASQILAVGDSYEDVYAKLDELGIPLSAVVHDFVEDMANL